MNVSAEVSTRNAVELADRVNAAFEAGEVTRCNGGVLVSRFGRPVAQAWGNGTVSVTVQGKGRGKVNTLYIKVGAPLSAV